MTEEFAHLLAEGASEIARCWRVTRRDGVTYGFTDHDADVAFEGQIFKANTGLSASALTQSTGLSVDNSEAVGALSDAAVRAEDLAAGRFDDAQVEAWHVCWSKPDLRELVFRGTLGEVTRQGQSFAVELRGLSEALNQPTGRVYHKACSAVLGDAHCKVDLDDPAHFTEAVVALVEENRVFQFKGLDHIPAQWFDKGMFQVGSGQAHGLSGLIKNDRLEGALRRVELWVPLGAAVAEGDAVRLTTGCDKRMETCRLKFNNLLNFRGFPDIPGEGWLTAFPGRAWTLDGGSRR